MYFQMNLVPRRDESEDFIMYFWNQFLLIGNSFDNSGYNNLKKLNALVICEESIEFSEVNKTKQNKLKQT